MGRETVSQEQAYWDRFTKPLFVFLSVKLKQGQAALFRNYYETYPYPYTLKLKIMNNWLL